MGKHTAEICLAVAVFLDPLLYKVVAVKSKGTYNFMGLKGRKGIANMCPAAMVILIPLAY